MGGVRTAYCGGPWGDCASPLLRVLEFSSPDCVVPRGEHVITAGNDVSSRRGARRSREQTLDDATKKDGQLVRGRSRLNISVFGRAWGGRGSRPRYREVSECFDLPRDLDRVLKVQLQGMHTPACTWMPSLPAAPPPAHGPHSTRRTLAGAAWVCRFAQASGRGKRQPATLGSFLPRMTGSAQARVGKPIMCLAKHHPCIMSRSPSHPRSRALCY